jgi:hypothetical protein
MKRFAVTAVLFVGAAIVACTDGAIVIGDDTDTNTRPQEPDPLIDPDAEPFDASTDDVPPITVSPEAGKDASSDAADAAKDVTCPTLSPPAPGFCDGASPVPKYDSNACIVGYGCALLDCAIAGGQCVGLSPTACPAPKKIGDATKYTCGGGIGVACCLP